MNTDKSARSKLWDRAILGPLRTIKQAFPNLWAFRVSLPRLTAVTDIGGQGVKMKWPPETVRIMRMLPATGIFLTGIESADPWVDGVRRNQLREAHNFELYYEQRLQRIYDLGIRWLRFGVPYSQIHTGPGQYDFSLMDKVMARCRDLGITIIADLLHFGLPEWMHANSPDTPFFQNPAFPELFAAYVKAFAERYPDIRYFTLVNEPMVTAYLSAKAGLWNEQLASDWRDDRAFVRAARNVARAAILGRQQIDWVWEAQRRPSEPLYVQNESFELALAAPESGREDEARRFNIRRFAVLDLLFGRHDPAMRQYLSEQGLSADDYAWFMEHGTVRRTVLGIDHYPWCIHTLEAGRDVDNTAAQPYQLYDLVKDYWQRYPLPLLHTEVNGQPEYAEMLCRETYLAVAKLRQEGYPIAGMGWYGDELQVGWQVTLRTIPGGFDEYPVGLYYKGQAQPVAALFRQLAEQGLPVAEQASQRIRLIRRIQSIIRNPS